MPEWSGAGVALRSLDVVDVAYLPEPTLRELTEDEIRQMRESQTAGSGMRVDPGRTSRGRRPVSEAA